MYTVGELVRGPFWPEVVEIKRYIKFSSQYYILEAVGRKTNSYYELMLDDSQIGSIERLSVNKHDKLKSGRDLQYYLQYHVLKLDQKYSESRSLGNKNIIPLPHQIDAVYNKMLHSPQVRYLLADDPGAGKTIMSGMLIRELRARKSAERILILVPPLVVSQWKEELQQKFDEEFTIINRSLMNEYPNQNPFEVFDLCIASMYWAARNDVKQFLMDTSFDLVIVDEAHKMAAYTHGKKTRIIARTSLYRLGESLLPHAPHRLLLTATPHKGDMENFRHLMKLIDTDVFAHAETNESLKDKTNPFIIRRLKEQMVHFDGSPIFPKRKTITIEFELTDLELELYERVTNYVEMHFNRAKNSGNNSTAFAMMVLQRRLSSSLESLYLSLKRRRERLERTYHEKITGGSSHDKAPQLLAEELDELSSEELEKVEQSVEGSTNNIDEFELMNELNQLDDLIERARFVRENGIERKYLELENTLFGPNGLITRGEKVLIFTEFKDTLNYLHSCLALEVPKIAVISGNLPIETRRQQMETFRNESPIMLATDAGGESINLQFCNQMINFDIPWNPNRLEQRMGRIHRIGQKNDVFVFNMVAKNTREGDVLLRLFNKMEKMKEDLGQELVYDFIGEVLEDYDTDLATIMNEAIVSRSNIDEKMANVEKALTDEHRKLVSLVKDEGLAENDMDLSSLRKSRQELAIKSLPLRTYTQFLLDTFENNRIRVYESSNHNVFRIDRFPKSVRDFAKLQGMNINTLNSSYRFTYNRKNESDELELIQNDSTMFQLAMELAAQSIQQIASRRYKVFYPIREPYRVNIYRMSIGDGTGRELYQTLKIIGKNTKGTFIELDPYWIFFNNFEKKIEDIESTNDAEFNDEIIKIAEETFKAIKSKKDEQLYKKQQFLRRTFELQYKDISDKLARYYQEGNDSKSIVIQQLKNSLEEIERKKEERLGEAIREQTVFLKPIQNIMQLDLIPNGNRQKRINPSDYFDIVMEYERMAGRFNIKKYNAYALVDFTTLEHDGKPRYIILLPDGNMLNKQHREDLEDIKEFTYIYQIKDQGIIQEKKLECY
ncbi:DEAD/DEAH box helicase [Bacillus salipaludis]|uniref:Helicase-related protein n=1 Tax=Bacillus salipaludis TaxID=2547811 RepID=A0AA90R0V4_9BACI|nr:helicase-related protein [Bacillus salipaludis]MDQ6598103.1 helicase-related protein [Bacillus salipaludis]